MTSEGRMVEYHTIYEQLYECPLISLHEIAENTGISMDAVSQYLHEMYKSSILKGPAIFLKPAKNYYQHIHFLAVSNPLSAYESFAGSRHTVSVNIGCGQWNSLVISEEAVGLSGLEGSEKCVHHGRKGVTSLSKVTSLDWDQSLENIHSKIAPPTKESMLYEEIPAINWNTKEWTLYDKLKYNVRAETEPILKECEISYQQYQKWLAKLPEVAVIQPAFYPARLDDYSLSDFLFRSQYQKQLVTILGMLPSTSLYFSAGDHLFVRVFVPDRNNLTSLVLELETKGYFTDVYHSTAVLASGGFNEQNQN
jgi:hypothetical protein